MAPAPVSAWADAYGASLQPTQDGIAAFIAAPEWGALCGALERTYGAVPLLEYSGCAAQPGWNIKYKKGGRALCTLYPMQGFFICMVSIAPKDEEAAALLLPGLSRYTQDVFTRSTPSKMGRWLMLEVRERTVLEDALQLIAFRMAKR